MIRTFTQNDVLRYVYNELKPGEARALEQQLLIDNDLMECYRELKEQAEGLNDTLLSASRRTLDSILNYSKSVNLHPVK